MNWPNKLKGNHSFKVQKEMKKNEMNQNKVFSVWRNIFC